MRGQVERAALAALATLATLATLAAAQNVTVVRQRFALEELHTIVIDYSTEYILDFEPTAEQSRWPTRVWVSSDGGDVSRPLLITHRQRAGAGTWQVPHLSGGRLRYEFERTLCPRDSADDSTTDCAGAGEQDGEGGAGGFSLHATSACARPLRVQVRADPARDWTLRPDDPLVTTINPWTPRVHHYEFAEDEQRVRLVVESEDDVCATVIVQNYTCPIGETLEEMTPGALHMTVLRSGGVQLARSRYPRGFYIVAIAHETDAACVEEEAADEDWLWEAAVFGGEHARPARARAKTLVLRTRPALTLSQYMVATGVTLAVFLAVYVAVGAMVLMQRWPRFGRLVWPKAVLQDTSPENGIESQADVARSTADTPRRRRRTSDATFDSSDMSDTDSDSEAPRAPVPAGPTGPTAAPAIAGAISVSSPALPAEAPARPGNALPGQGDDSPNGRNGLTGGGDNSPDGRNGSVGGGDVSPDGRNGSAGRGDTSHDGPNGSGGGTGTASVAVVGDTETDHQQRPYGLPARLRVAALARRKARVLRARSDRYLTTLATVAVFYALPVVQFVVAFQIVMNVSGSLDLCYFNFLCAHPAGELSDFNHVFSNLGYLVLGALFVLQLQRRRRARRRVPRHDDYGIPAHYGLLASLGAGMMVVALLSASYHVCPNRLNFQFDVAFMYVLAVLSMVKIYQARHPDVNARAHATFGVLAVLIAVVVWGVLGGGALFWGVFTVLHVFTFLLLSLRIYYIGQFRLEKETLQWAARELRQLPARGLRPLYTARLVMLLIANAVNWAFALYGLATQSADFASHLLFVLLANTLVYMAFYMCMKLLHGERPRWYAWCYLAGAAAAWAPALYFFTSGSSSWSSTPAQSRHRNHECRVLQFYDAHDLWHFLSAAALYLTFCAMLTWDDGLSAVPRSEIAVF